MATLRIRAPQQSPVPLSIREGGTTPGTTPGGEAATMAGAGRGITGGWMDELRARLAAIGPEGYETELRRIQAERDAQVEQFPMESAVGEVIGTGMGAALPFGATTKVATAIPRLAAWGSRVVPRVLGAAGTGAAVATAESLGRSNELGWDRFSKNTAVDAGLGAAGGVAGEILLRPALAQIAKLKGSRVAEFAQKWFRDRALAGGREVDDVVQEIIDGGIPADANVTMREAARALRDTGTPAAAAKVADTAVDRARSSGTKAMQTVQEELSPGGIRTRAQVADAQQAIDDSFKPRYQQAYATAQPVDAGLTSAMETTLQRNPDVARQIWTAMRRRGIEPYFQVDDTGTLTFTGTPTVEQAEIIRRAMMERATQARRGEGGFLPSDVEALQGAETSVRQEVDRLSPDLEATRADYAAKSRIEDAYEQGLAIDISKVAPEELELITRRLSPDQLNAFREGLAAKLRGKISTQPRGRQSLIDQMSDDSLAAGENLANVLPPGANMQRVNAALEQARRSKALVQEVGGGSPTAGRQERNRSLVEAGDPLAGQQPESILPIIARVGTDPVSMGAELMNSLGPSMQRAGVPKEYYDHVANLLLADASQATMLRRVLSDPSDPAAAAKLEEMIRSAVARIARGAAGYGASSALDADADSLMGMMMGAP